MAREADNIDIKPSDRKIIMNILKRYLPNTEVWAYGSRVKLTSRPSSDLDLAVFSLPEQREAVNSLKDALEDSNLSFRVDVFVWDEVPDSFHKNIESERVVLQECGKTRTKYS
ncbi:MAG: hypothetical protein B0D92_07120 [Spirochaeta sp. LUC14_002_19_P3]|nr:MAG: hypothetical protein B0D92_07120 [Spirochaeta sp. LUC14_002_19_P3]